MDFNQNQMQPKMGQPMAQPGAQMPQGMPGQAPMPNSMAGQMPGQAPMGQMPQGMPGQYNPYMYGNVPSPNVPKDKSKISATEFKFGTFVLGMVGVLFVLSSLVVFGIYFLDSFWQGLLLYLIGALICGVGAFFYVKKFDKMGVFFGGLGLCTLYVTTFINYYYLKSMSGLAAFIVNVTITVVFLGLSLVKETTVMRIICIIGCFVTLISMDSINSAWDIVLPITVLIVVNCFCYFFPVQKATILADAVEYAMSFVVLCFFFVHMDDADYATWPCYILFAIHVMAIYLIVKKHKKEGAYLAFGIVGNIFYLFFMFGMTERQDWNLIAMACTLVVFVAATFLLRQSPFRTLPIYAGSAFSIFVVMLDGNDFIIALSMLALLVLYRVCAMLFKELQVPDYIVNVLVAFYVITATRDGDAQFIGYIIAILIVISSFLVKYYNDLYIVTGIIFAATFIETESFSVMIRAAVVCAYAVVLIIGGFITKKSVVRFSGIILVVVGAIEMIADSVMDVSPMVKMITFFVAGVVILTISIVYMVIEKKNENKADKIEGEDMAQAMANANAPISGQQPVQMPQMAAGQAPVQMPQMAAGQAPVQMPQGMPGQMPMYPGAMQAGAQMPQMAGQMPQGMPGQMPMYPGAMQPGAQMPQMAGQMPQGMPGQMPMYPGAMQPGTQMPQGMPGQAPMYPGNGQMR